jgi:ABC-2 type transport system ATP-binding protein
VTNGSQISTKKEPSEERYWSRFAPSYDRDGQYIVGKSILQVIGQRLADERNLGDCVEFGCGTGYLTRAIAGTARSVIATDLSDEMLAVARTQLGRFRNVTTQKADCANTGFPAETYDSVLMANLIHVMDEPLPCLREGYRILKTGGVLILVDFTSYRLNVLRTARLGLRYLRRWGLPPREGRHALSPEELERLVESAGFRVEGVELLQAESNALYLRALKCARSRSSESAIATEGGRQI